MFEAVRKLFDKKPEPVAEATASFPDKDVHRKAWVVLEDGRVAYIHHYKINGLFGVRPVGFYTGRHYPSPVEHWTQEQRLTIPEELALSIREFRAATTEEVPEMWRPH